MGIVALPQSLVHSYPPRQLVETVLSQSARTFILAKMIIWSGHSLTTPLFHIFLLFTDVKWI